MRHGTVQWLQYARPKSLHKRLTVVPPSHRAPWRSLTLASHLVIAPPRCPPLHRRDILQSPDSLHQRLGTITPRIMAIIDTCLAHRFHCTATMSIAPPRCPLHRRDILQSPDSLHQRLGTITPRIMALIDTCLTPLFHFLALYPLAHPPEGCGLFPSVRTAT